jgi:putative ABC transport system permease protein
LFNRFRIPAARVRTMDDAGLESTADRNFNAVLVMLFTCVAVFLGAVGVYSVMSYTVESRTAEIGIRSALGATPFNNLRLILVYALQLTAVAIPIGVALSFPFIGLIRTQLYGVRSNDMLNIVLVCACISVVALLAAYIPARRASKMNVLVALRHE